MNKVLMLGWEFPPLFNGGLGVATYGIVKSLSQNTNIRLIIPSASDNIDLSNVRISGLNKLTAEDLDLEKLQYRLSFQNTALHEIPIRVSAYHHSNVILQNEVLEKEEAKNLSSIHARKNFTEKINDLFSDKEVYGRNIMYKVHMFPVLAEEIAASHEFDIIHAHDWITFPAAVNIKRKTGKPLVLHVHSLETDRADHTTRNEIYHLEKNALQEADRIIAVSQFTKDQIVEHYGIDADRITVVHNGIDPINITRKEHQLKDKMVVFLGRITNQKGPQFLLETAEKVVRVYPRVKFVVAGTGDLFTHLLESSAYKKLGSKFIFTGFLSKAKVNELLSMADVYFMPSVSEPFGLTALEAAQYKIPSVISTQSGAAEVLASSLKADFWDTDKYANYNHALLKYNVLSKALTDHAQGELNTLTWAHAAKKIDTVYSTL
jgi:glycosyltransferase involved in cell wall biosynthesis